MTLLKEFKAIYNRKPTGSEFFKGYNLGRGYWFLKDFYKKEKLQNNLIADFERFFVELRGLIY